MSDSQTPRHDPEPRPPDGCTAVLMVLVGLVLLLPGVCALVFVTADPKGMLTDWDGLLLVLVCATITAGGVALIWSAGRRPKP
jgi:hypothetical protein